MEEFDALTSLVLGEPILKFGTYTDMLQQFKDFGPVDAVMMEHVDWIRLLDKVSPTYRPTTGTEAIMLFGVPVYRMPAR